MTARQTTTGTPADGYKADPPPVPLPRNGEDPREPGRRATPAHPTTTEGAGR